MQLTSYLSPSFQVLSPSQVNRYNSLRRGDDLNHKIQRHGLYPNLHHHQPKSQRNSSANKKKSIS